jgi:nudix-type nucleoside diphosphatase (YffH/AdpP family)
MKILSEKTVLNNWFHVEEAEIDTGSAVVSRMRLNRSEAAAILVYNTESGKIILTRQFRYAIAQKTGEYILEVAAGKTDPGESPEQTAIRECHEEIGYHIAPAKLTLVASCFMSPGYSSELLHHYYAEVTNADKLSEGGGLKSEDEEITIVEMDREQFLQEVRAARINDAKSLLLGYWYLSQDL